MVRRLVFFLAAGLLAGVSFAQQGGIRGTVMDQDFEVPLPGVKITLSETGQETESGETGSYVFEGIEPAAYTLFFSKSGYARLSKSGVVVSPGKLVEADASLVGEYEEMDELVVRDIQLGGASEIGLLNLRMESVAMMDSVGADLMSQAGASDAAQALALVPGTTIQDGKFAVVRGLPDRYVSSQMNGVRLPTADPDKRAVQLDQFPAAMIESIQVTKTFTPDQQGDASGGAVNVVLKGIPDKRVLTGGVGYEINTQVQDAGDDFLTYQGSGLNYWGVDNGRDPQPNGQPWTGAVGVSRAEAEPSYKWGVTAGDKIEFDTGFKLGAVGSFYYKQDASYFDGGVNDSYWLDGDAIANNHFKVKPGGMVPQYSQGAPSQGNYLTSLYDTTKGSQSIQWGGLAGFGAETENHALNLLYFYTRNAEETAVLEENTRGKKSAFPDHDPYDSSSPGHYQDDDPNELEMSPYARTESIEYEERTTETIQLRGDHAFPVPELGLGSWFKLLDPKADWTLAKSSSTLYSPDKRQFGSLWTPAYQRDLGFIVFDFPAAYRPLKNAANVNIGNLQRVWQDISEESDQYNLNGTLPFEQWSGDEGFLKMGIFNDEVERSFNQDSYSNPGAPEPSYDADWSELWSAQFPQQNLPISAATVDVDYTGDQQISAWYYMADLPVWSGLNFVGGARYEKTDLSIVNIPEKDVFWYPNGVSTELKPGEADVDFSQDDVLPSLGFELRPVSAVTFRGSYSETVARQTFKELTPIQQQEYYGADVFIGNPNLQMSALKNYDLRLDYTPYPGGLISFSWFKKDVENPIEYVQQLADFTFTTPVNYSEGTLDGYEMELRQSMGRLWDGLEGLSLGGNLTLIDSEVTLPASETIPLEDAGYPRSTRDMLNAPEYLYNLNATYMIERFGTELGIFYTVKGDSLVAGAGLSNGKFVPDVYQKETGSLNFSISQKLGDHFKISFKAKNLTDPDIQEVYRSQHIDGDVVKTSYTKGIDYSIDLSATW